MITSASHPRLQSETVSKKPKKERKNLSLFYYFSVSLAQLTGDPPLLTLLLGVSPLMGLSYIKKDLTLFNVKTNSH